MRQGLVIDYLLGASLSLGVLGSGDVARRINI